jgi:hypothetical protein
VIKVVVAAAFAAASSRGAQAVRLYANVLKVNVCVWHQANMSTALSDVCFRGEKRTSDQTAVTSACDPKRTSRPVSDDAVGEERRFIPLQRSSTRQRNVSPVRKALAHHAPLPGCRRARTAG